MGRSPKTHYRSHYVYLGWEDPSPCSGQALEDPAAWEHLSNFDLLLRLVDYTPDGSSTCAQTDQDKTLWPLRGYDDKGRPVCPFGYTLKANGFDPSTGSGHSFDRQCHKWACFHTYCNGTAPLAPLEGATYPPDQCPYLARPYGQLINVDERFKDGSIRLVRDIPVGTPAWKRIYHRARNAAEGRNSAFESWGFKRPSVYGDLRGKALAFQADAWLNLTTLARLVREATAATGA